MDSSKFSQGSDECSSSESGWTAYIASSDHEDDHGDRSKDEDEEDDDDNKEANSDDSMASDASSGPSYHYGGHPFGKHHGFEHAKNINGRNEAGKKKQKQEDKRSRGEKIKVAKHMVDRAARLKKK